jgi:DNA-binding SARP family transcriptional activator
VALVALAIDAIELRVLGPLEAFDGATPLPLGGRKPRALLARLAIDANRTVPVHRLVDDLWGEDVPDSAAKMVQIYVSQLRKVLPDGVLRTRAPGYVVEVRPECVDVNRFALLRAEGRAALAAGDPDTAAARLREALALWRGPALAEFSEPFAIVEAAHLEELRLVCLEERIEADVARGLDSDVVGELEALVARHPLRESLHRQLTLALYRTGRQADALAAYERFRHQLDDELGIEPSAAMRTLQHNILIQDPRLEPASSLTVAPRRVARGRDRFLGRADEVRRLEAELDAAASGAGTTMLVSGHAGMGKTRLTAELAERARARGATVLSGRCIQLVGSGLSYLPLVEALRPLAGYAALGDLPLRELPRLMPELAGDDAVAPADGARSDTRLALFQEVLAVLAHLSATAPVLLVLEDLHWADESTLDLVAFLANATGDHRILLVVTYRSEQVRPEHHLYRLATSLAAGEAAGSLALAPLPHADIEKLLETCGDERLPSELAAAIATRAGGNPFFACELRAAALRGETALPPALREALLGDIARLGASAGSVLRVAAAAGRDVSYGLLDVVTPLGELQLARALREAVEHDVLVPDQSAGTFRFRHPLFAEALYGTLLPGEREVLHERLARTLTERPALAASGAAAAEAAQHWAAAGRPDESLAASLRAAREAEAVSGLTEALRHVERVLELWDRVPAAEQRSGIALPSVLAWAAELADDGALGTAPLAVGEARRLYPTVVVLESMAVRQMPRLDRAALDALRAANERLRTAAGDATAATAADDDFHRELVAGCGNEHLLTALDPVRRALLRYERVYLLETVRIERSAAQHDGIIEALERGDHAEAAQRVRENLAHGLPDLREALER